MQSNASCSFWSAMAWPISSPMKRDGLARGQFHAWMKKGLYLAMTMVAVLCILLVDLLFGMHQTLVETPLSVEARSTGLGTAFKMPFTGEQLMKDLNFTVPPVALRRGIGHMGDMLRLDAFLEKVIVDRKPPTVVMVGGSVTRKVGGWRGDQGRGLDKQHMTCEKHFCTSLDGWMASTLKWLTDTFPPLSNHPRAGYNASGFGEPPAKFQLINIAIGGRGADVYFACMGDAMLRSLPDDVDLVVMDFAVNGASMAHGWRSTKAWAERLMWRLETLYPSVAMVFVNWHHWCQKTPLSDFGCVSPKDRKIAVPRTWETMNGTFSLQDPYNNEEAMLILAQYYGVPLLSVRNILYALVAGQVPGYAKQDIVAASDQGTHPSPLQATTLYSNIFVHFMYTAISTYLTRHAENQFSATLAGHSALKVWPPPLFEDLLEELQQLNLTRCYSTEAADLGFPGVERPFIVQNQGWEYGPDTDALVPNMKKGFITRKTGSSFQVVMDTRSGCQIVARGRVVVRMWYLSSYGLMGKVQYSCVSGCTCSPGTIDALSGDDVVRESVPKNLDLMVTPATECTIGFVSEAGPKGSKFKFLEFEVIGRASAL